jgi:uncharacterized protein (DUF1015 family)
MKEAFLLLVSILFSITLYANGIIGETESSHNAFLKTQDSLISQIHPTIKQLFMTFRSKNRAKIFVK